MSEFIKIINRKTKTELKVKSADIPLLIKVLKKVKPWAQEIDKSEVIELSVNEKGKNILTDKEKKQFASFFIITDKDNNIEIVQTEQDAGLQLTINDIPRVIEELKMVNL